MNISIRAPEGDMTKGHQPTIERSAMPLTVMAASSLSKKDEVTFPNNLYNIDGYADYRGVTVIGAWTWMPKYQMGLTSEVDKVEAYQTLIFFKRVSFLLLILVIIGVIMLCVYELTMRKVKMRLNREAIKAKELGQYKLKELIGEGGMGNVYRAEHKLMQRPTAIKLLKPSLTQDSGRFAMEVQSTCKLSHPNTIAIYDYGHTDEGVFYYAMEYLNGCDCSFIISQGPQPAARVIHILIQASQSLHEAHEQGLIHRDIKPQTSGHGP